MESGRTESIVNAIKNKSRSDPNPNILWIDSFCSMILRSQKWDFLWRPILVTNFFSSYSLVCSFFFSALIAITGNIIWHCGQSIDRWRLPFQSNHHRWRQRAIDIDTIQIVFGERCDRIGRYNYTETAKRWIGWHFHQCENNKSESWESFGCD